MSHCTWWPPSNLHPASFLFLSGWVWCRLTWRSQSLQRVPPACQPPGRSLNQGTEWGDMHHTALRRKIPEGAVTLHNPPPPPTLILHHWTPPSFREARGFPSRRHYPPLRDHFVSFAIIYENLLLNKSFHTRRTIDLLSGSRRSRYEEAATA